MNTESMLFRRIIQFMIRTNDELINGLNTMLNIHNCTFYHDKRCLYAYLYVLTGWLMRRKHRLDKIRECLWAKGPLNTPEAQSVMSKGESKYHQDYNQLLNTYIDDCGFDITAVVGFDTHVTCRICIHLIRCMWRWFPFKTMERLSLPLEM